MPLYRARAETTNVEMTWQNNDMAVLTLLTPYRRRNRLNFLVVI